MEKPILFLDVDGVLNVDYHRGTPRKGTIVREIPLGHPQHVYTVYLDPSHGPWLNELTEHFELVWATTWEDEANEYLLEHLGLPPLPVVPFTAEAELRLPLPDLLPQPKFSDRHNTWIWKAPSVLRYAGDRPFYWFDDDFSLLHDHLWAEKRNETVPTYLEHVRPHKGLMRHHVEKAILWVQSLED
jgi:hypothetical protein